MDEQKKTRGGNTWVWVIIVGILILGVIMVVNARRTTDVLESEVEEQVEVVDEGTLVIDETENDTEVEEVVVEDSELQEPIDAEVDR